MLSPGAMSPRQNELSVQISRIPKRQRALRMTQTPLSATAQSLFVTTPEGLWAVLGLQSFPTAVPGLPLLTGQMHSITIAASVCIPSCAVDMHLAFSGCRHSVASTRARTVGDGAALKWRCFSERSRGTVRHVTRQQYQHHLYHEWCQPKGKQHNSTARLASIITPPTTVTSCPLTPVQLLGDWMVPPLQYIALCINHVNAQKKTAPVRW